MRVIENKMLKAIVEGKNINCGNTVVKTFSGLTRIYLFKNLIAEVSDKVVRVNNCGYKTKTTKSRLNAILCLLVKDKFILQKNFDWYISDAGNYSLCPDNCWVEFKNSFLIKSFINV